MRVRAERELTREEIGRVVAAAIEGFQDETDHAIANVAPGSALTPLDEPMNQANRLRGKAALYDSILTRNDVVDRTGSVRGLAHAVLGRAVEQDSAEERRLCRAVIKAVQAEMLPAAVEFDQLASNRPATSNVRIASDKEYDAAPEKLAALRSATPGDNLTSLLDRLTPVAEVAPARAAHTSSRSATPAPLRNASALMSELWSKFIMNKVLMKEWKEAEARGAGTTLKLWLQCIGDKRPCDYCGEDVSSFHRLMKEMPSDYYHNKSYRCVYLSEGALAVIAMSRGHVVDRMTDKTWNSHNSSLNAFF